MTPVAQENLIPKKASWDRTIWKGPHDFLSPRGPPRAANSGVSALAQAAEPVLNEGAAASPPRPRPRFEDHLIFKQTQVCTILALIFGPETICMRVFSRISIAAAILFPAFPLWTRKYRIPAALRLHRSI